MGRRAARGAGWGGLTLASRAHEVVELSAGPVRYRDTGSGEPIVFMHGVVMNGDTWAPVVPRLADRHRCVWPDWPTGGHRLPLHAAADLTPSSLADLVDEFLAALDLERVTLVGIGLGTVLAQILAIRHPARIARVVFGSGDILATFPPPWARTRFAMAFVPPVGGLVVRVLRAPRARRFAYRQFAHRLDDDLLASYTAGLTRDPAIRRDTFKLMRAIWRGETHERHEALRSFDKPSLVLWGADDVAFPHDHPDQLAALLSDVRVERLAGARTFLAQDRPEAFADAIARFVDATRA